MRIAILGYGTQGQAAYKYWSKENDVTIHDANTSTAIPKGAQSKLGTDYLDNLDEYDLLIRTPVLHPNQIAEANPDHPEILSKVWSVTNEFFKVCPSKNIIGVTGTKGKGTTSTLITRMLEAAGKRVHLGGNIGIPPLDMLQNNIQPDDWVVLELANFQLIDLAYSPPIAVCLMVEPEHQDWHSDLDEYIGAKQQLFVHQKTNNIAVYYGSNEYSKRIVNVSDATKIPYMQKPGAVVAGGRITIDGEALCRTDELVLVGKHNWQNVCAATTAVWQITKDVNAIRKTLVSFQGLPYRIEHVATVNDVQYYNDSFATAPGATIAAIEAITAPKVVIVGGFDRGLPLDPLVNTFVKHKDNIKKVIIIGESADRVKKECSKAGFTDFVHEPSPDMQKIVKRAASYAKPGHSVILSPAFASFDMFKNFEERGKAFNTAVRNLL